MKLKLALLLLALAGYIGFEYTQGREPHARLSAAIETMYSGPSRPATIATAPKPTEMSTPVVAAVPTEDVLVLSAPPRDGAEGGNARFTPIAEYLSEKLGRKVVYKHPGTWGGYQSDMQANAYDIVFDGPHFVSWRIDHLKHNVLVKLPGDPLIVVGFVRNDNIRIKQVTGLAGQTICAHAPPNLGLLSVQNEFDNPTRQPNFLIMEGFGAIYQGVQEGKCVAGIVPKKNLQQKDPNSEATRIVYEHAPFPEQAFTAGPRLSAIDQQKVAAALTAPEADAVLEKFRKAYATKGTLLTASNNEYQGYAVYLKPVQGFFEQKVVAQR